MQWIDTALLPILGGIITLGNLASVIVMHRRQHRPTTFSLTLLSLAMLIWLGGSLAMLLLRSDVDRAITADRIGYIGVVWLPAIMYHFTTQYMQLPSRRLLLPLYGLSALFLISVSSNLFVHDLYTFSWGVHTQAGILHHFFSAYIIAASLILYRLCFSYYRNHRGDAKRRQEISIILSAYTLFLGTGVAAFLPAYNIDIPPFSYAVTPLFLGLLTFGVMAQSAFDVRRGARLIMLSLALASYVGGLFIGANNLANAVFGAAAVRDNYVVITFILVVILSFTYGSFQSWIERILDERLFKDERGREDALRALSEDLNKALDLRTALELLATTAARGLRSSHERMVSVIFSQANELTEQESTDIKELYATGYPTSPDALVVREDGMVVFFTERQESVFCADLAREVEAEEQQIAAGNLPKAAADRARFIRNHAIKASVSKRFDRLRATVAIPLFLKQQLIGLVIVGGNTAELPPFREVSDWLSELATAGVAGIQKANLYQVDQLKTEFVSIASHELRTPLTAIRGYLSMILEEGIAGKELDPERREYLGRVYTIARQLAMLVNDLLTISRIESGKMQFTPQAIEISPFLQGILQTTTRVAQQRNVTVRMPEHNEKAALPAVWADEAGLKELLTNLMTNAITYNKIGGQVSVSYKVWTNEKQLEVTISDTGIGMSKEQMQHLFERFYRIDSPETSGIAGTGLGLYLCKLITERMGGSINVESVPKRGTTFRVYLPLAK
jgi:signal transduction histidine kinase